MLALSKASGISSDLAATRRWLVSNGDTTVGPVHTELLLRGYMGGRIPEHCQVREVSWGTWRPLDGVRELGSLKRRLAHDTERPLSLREAAERLPLTGDTSELLSLGLQLAAQALNCHCGLVHRSRKPVSGLVTSTVLGVMPEVLGEVLPATDPSYALALRGRGLCGNPRSGSAERIVAERLQHDGPLTGVVMSPVIVSGRLVALLELGRAGHAFRVDDADDLAEFAGKLARRLG